MEEAAKNNTPQEEIRKPSVLKVISAEKEKVAEVKTVVDGAVAQIAAARDEKLDALNATKNEQLAGINKEKEAAVAASQAPVDEKALAVKAAAEALAKAQAEFDAANQEHQKRVSTLSETFNKAAEDVKAKTAIDARATQRAYQDSVDGEKVKLSDAKKAARAAAWDEAKALMSYEAFVTKSTFARLGHSVIDGIVDGIPNATKSLAAAFKKGFKRDTGVKVPKKLVVAPAAKPAEPQQ